MRRILDLGIITTLAAVAAWLSVGCASSIREPWGKHLDIHARGLDVQAVSVYTGQGAAAGGVSIAPTSVPASEPPHTWAVTWPERGPAFAVEEPAPLDPQAWLNPGGVAYHLDPHCRFVRRDATQEPLSRAQEHRRPCRACGGGVE